MNKLIFACADEKNVFYADPDANLAPAGQGVSPAMEADCLHPSPLGYENSQTVWIARSNA